MGVTAIQGATAAPKRTPATPPHRHHVTERRRARAAEVSVLSLTSLVNHNH